MKILVIGSGGREHALVWKLAQSPKAERIFVAPGNAGTGEIATNLNVGATDLAGLATAAREHHIDLAVVGPESALEVGVVDLFKKIGIPIFGPTAKAARIETSKVFSKVLMEKYRIPCARGATFTDLSAAKRYIQQQGAPIVVKADGLAAGKGVFVAKSTSEAVKALNEVMQAKSFGAAGDRVVVEECLVGDEMSAFSFSDGGTVVPFAAACDYKRVGDSDKGPNTGGMGSYSPPYFYTPGLEQTVQSAIMKPAIRALASETSPYQGILYGGLMITAQGPKALEFNARFGDPEAQVILPRLKTDLVDIMMAVIDGKLDRVKIEIRPEACVAVVLASGGYPGKYQTGLPITGLETVDKEVMVFHAGTKAGPRGELLTNGGRVLAVSALGRSLDEAREKVYANVARIKFSGCQFRKDIGKLG